MKHLFLTLATLLLLTSCGGVAPKQESGKAPERDGWLEEIPLYGDIERVYVSTYFETTFEDKSTISSLESEYCYTFNSRGDVAEMVESCNMGNSFSMSEAWTRCQYTYDDAGRIIEERWYNNLEDVSWRSRYIYSLQGVLIEEQSYNNSDRLRDCTLYKYDSQGRLTEAEHLDNRGVLQWREHFKYNADGELIEKIGCYADGTIDFKIVYSYDERGNLINKRDLCDEKEEQCERKFDSRGNIIEELYYTDSDKSSCRRVKYEIQYRK